jgi:hypothetical protein
MFVPTGARLMLGKLVRVETVEVGQGFTVRVRFTDGSERDIDLEPYLYGPAFEQIRSHRAAFVQVAVDPVSRTLAWPNGADIDPDVLYLGVVPLRSAHAQGG